jgi:hypothetical protein
MKKLLGTTLALALMLPGGQAFAQVEAEPTVNVDSYFIWADNVTDFQSRPIPGGAAGVDTISGQGAHRIQPAIKMKGGAISAKVGVSATANHGSAAPATAGPGLPVVNAAPAFPSGAADTAGVGNAVNLTGIGLTVGKELLGDLFELGLGRQSFGEPGDIIAYWGPSAKPQYGLPITSIDAVTVGLGGEGASAKIFWGKPVVGAGGTAAASTIGATNLPGETDIRGLIFSRKANESATLGAYIWNRVIHRTGGSGVPSNDVAFGTPGGKNDNLWIFGLKTKFSSGGGNLALELAKNFGENRGAGGVIAGMLIHGARNYNGYAMKADMDYTAELEGMGSLTPWGHFAYGSGDRNTESAHNYAFQDLNGDYRPGSIYGRFITPVGAGAGVGLGTGLPAVAGLPFNPTALRGPTGAGATISNRTVVGLGVKMKPAMMNKLTVGLSFYDYRASSLLTQTGVDKPFLGNKHLGGEFDLDLSYDADLAVVSAGLGSFQPGGLIKEHVKLAGAAGRGVSPATLAYVDLKLKF